MVFSMRDAVAFLNKYKWLIALMVAVAFGYTFGKDRTLRDNAAEQQAEGETS